ncbi:L-cystine transporter [Psychromonas sp. CD1]|uniref:L-cystine transporter n=1 Tax=Psychromonas sp. CD1 TaxID=1979839 RepID=UPI000B9B6295|nr:cation:dicarboxylase symporter family transporter [Psychromonas sp. CD1]
MVLMINLAIFSVLLLITYWQQRQKKTLSRLVLIALILGTLFGLTLQFVYADQKEMIFSTLLWVNVVGIGYVSFLKMIIMPLVFVSMLSAVVKLDKSGELGKISFLTIALLLFTTMIAALIGIMITQGFGLTAAGLTEGSRETAKAFALSVRMETVSALTIPDMILSFIPQNPFLDLTGVRSTSIIAIVIFAVLLGISARKVSLENERLATPIMLFVDAIQSVVMRLVKMIMTLTPYGILALLTKVVASSNGADILNLLGFIIASYVAIILMFVVHGVLVSIFGINPVQFFKKIWPVLTFAFSSRSSVASIPLNVETQINQLGVAPMIANLSATFGSTIGQNGCAGIYPAMLAVMVAPTMGIAIDINFILSLILIVMVSSFGIAGIGGGATFAALIVLPAMGLPVEIVALLISIEPLIDMARTALNVSGSMTTGLLVQRVIGWEIKKHQSISEKAKIKCQM